MGRKLYVGNLPFTTTEPQLVEIFEQIGRVQSVKIISDPLSGRSKGFGFVEMVSESDALKAIDRFHGAEFEGRPLTVSEAKSGAEPRRRAL